MDTALAAFGIVWPATMTHGNSNPFDAWQVITRTASARARGRDRGLVSTS